MEGGSEGRREGGDWGGYGIVLDEEVWPHPLGSLHMTTISQTELHFSCKSSPETPSCYTTSVFFPGSPLATTGQFLVSSSVLHLEVLGSLRRSFNPRVESRVKRRRCILIVFRRCKRPDARAKKLPWPTLHVCDPARQRRTE